MAVVQREVSDRSFFGKVVKWSFVLFNILMLIWMIGGMSAASQSAANAVNDAERAGAAIGTGLGFTFLLFIWGFGDIILGLLVLLTRRRKLVTDDEPTA